MKAITLWQPWASLIADNLKTIETRNHGRFRCLTTQRIAIHAAARSPSPAYLNECGFDVGVVGNDEASYWLACHPGGDIDFAPLGCIVCTAEVVKVGWLDGTPEQDLAALCPTGPTQYGRFGLWLNGVRKLKTPIPCKGAQGIWTVPDGMIPRGGAGCRTREGKGRA